MIQVSIPGKIHLIGEHSVVYGHPAILSSISLYLRAKISNSNSKDILGLVQYDDALPKIQNAIEKKITEKFNVREFSSYQIEIDIREIPIGSGLGTSASLSAAFTICLLKFLEIKYTPKDVFEIAIEGEKIFHGNPSGGDLAAVLNKGLIYFKKNSGNKLITYPIPNNLKLNLVLIDSGKPIETTAEMVEKIRIKYQVSSIKLNELFKLQGDLTEQMVTAMKNGDPDSFIKIIQKAESNLEKMGVVGKTAKSIIRKIEHLGGTAKITGAGGIKKGSGMILAFHKDLNKLIKFAKDNNLKYYPVEISGEG